MSDIHDQIIKTAYGETDVQEDAGRNLDRSGRILEYNRAVKDRRYTMKKGDEYCAAFVSWVYEQVGRPLHHNFGEGFSYTPWMMEWAKAEGIWEDFKELLRDGDGLAPAQVIMTSEKGKRVDHVGIIVGIEDDGDTIVTVEGNYNSGVNERRYNINNASHTKKILGVFDPLLVV